MLGPFAESGIQIDSSRQREREAEVQRVQGIMIHSILDQGFLTFEQQTTNNSQQEGGMLDKKAALQLPPPPPRPLPNTLN